MLTEEQYPALKADINNSTDPVVVAARGGGVIGRNDTELARLYNLPSTTVVWRPDVTRAEVYHQTSREATTWNWTTYKNQTLAEQNAWTQMFMGDQADFSLPNLRAGVDAIFGGAGAAATQRAHITAAAKRFAKRAESLYVIGDGTEVSPAALVFVGNVNINDIGNAMNLPD